VIHLHPFCWTGLLAVALALTAGVLPAQKKTPPSSLQRSGAVVRFFHRHERVAECKMQLGSDGCVEQRVPARAGAEITLTPIESNLVARPEPSRSAAHLSLSDEQGSSAGELRLSSGDWGLSWADRQAEVRVTDGRDFQVQMSTVSGSCALVHGRCERNPEVVRRKVTIPGESTVVR